MEHENSENVLEHHGVKGMHWHVKRSTHSVTTPSGKTHSFKYNPAHKIAAKGKKALGERKAQIEADKARGESHDSAKASEAKRVARNAGTSHLSNAELQHLVNRMNLEQQYTHLTKGQNKTIETRAAEIVKTVGLNSIKTAKSPTTKTIGEAVQANFSAPKNGKKK